MTAKSSSFVTKTQPNAVCPFQQALVGQVLGSVILGSDNHDTAGTQRLGGGQMHVLVKKVEARNHAPCFCFRSFSRNGDGPWRLSISARAASAILWRSATIRSTSSRWSK